MKLSTLSLTVFLIALWGGFNAANSQAQVKLDVVTERTPITYRSNDNLADGQATELVQELIAKAGFEYQLYFSPWKRAYRRAETESNVIIYPLARTAERENKFHWIGQITPVHYYLFRLLERSDITVERLADVNRYKVGVVNFHAHHIFLKSQGIENLEPVNSNRQNFHKLLRKRVDLFASSSAGLLTLCEQEKTDCEKFVPALKLEGISKGLYIAASLDTPDDIVAKLRAAYGLIEKSGLLGKIMGERMNEQDKDRFLEQF
ncbi:MAG: transporter substrate-binding domain-containing protein [Cellvibrionaceae bacterium]|nr:transporter substrate-binding domain-containing protein [Cellvibrionaceae bacterium]